MIHLSFVTDKNDPISTVEALKNNGSISEDVLIFDEIYIMKCVEYAVGDSIGADENGNIYN